MVGLVKLFSEIVLPTRQVGVIFGDETICAILFHPFWGIRPTFPGQTQRLPVFSFVIHSRPWCGNEPAGALLLIRLRSHFIGKLPSAGTIIQIPP
jgi:hypothetical protein